MWTWMKDLSGSKLDHCSWLSVCNTVQRNARESLSGLEERCELGNLSRRARKKATKRQETSGQGPASALTNPFATPMSVPQTTASPRHAPRLRTGGPKQTLGCLSRSNLAAIAQPHARGPAVLHKDLLYVRLCPKECRKGMPPSSTALVSTFPEGLVSLMPSTSASISAQGPSVEQQAEENGDQDNK